MKIYNVGIYIRLSKEDEKDKESSSIESQREYIKEYINKNNYKFIKEYIDDGYTGTNFNRPSFKEMLNDINNKLIDMVIVKDLSRLGRNNSKVSYYIEEFFPINNIRFIALNNDYDSEIENTAREYAWLTNGINESYCQDISKKIRTALKIRKQKGYFTGWKAPYGYKKSKKDYHKLVIDKESSKIVKQIFDLAYQEKTISEIAYYLTNKNIKTPSNYANTKNKSNIWSPRTILDILTNETYIGNLVQGKRKKINYKIKKEIRTNKEDWIIINNAHKPIISKEKYEEVQKIINKNKYKRIKNNKLLQGLIYCKECNHKIGIIRSNDKKRYYLSCNYYRKNSKYKLCTPHTMNYDKLEKEIINIIKKELENIKDLKVSNKKIINKIKKIEKEILMDNNIIENSYIDYAKGLITVDNYKNINNKINNDIKNKEQELKILKKELNNYKINSLNINRELLSKMIDKIYINKNKEVELYLTYNNY